MHITGSAQMSVNDRDATSEINLTAAFQAEETINKWIWVAETVW